MRPARARLEIWDDEEAPFWINDVSGSEASMLRRPDLWRRIKRAEADRDEAVRLLREFVYPPSWVLPRWSDLLQATHDYLAALDQENET